ncbi:MAG TPA: DegQ family serine endoprotease [Thiolinea sp.]|nr:DegQ family serine endoprotease [Thiolinea sp.]
MTYQPASRMRLLQGLLAAALCLSASVQARSLPEFTELVKTNGPAVVNITTSHKQKMSAEAPSDNPGYEEGFDELMKRFFGTPDGSAPEDFSADARGSGFMLSADGYIITNHHVIENADEILVKLNDRREFPAKLIGSDKRSDVALLKIDATNLPTLKMGDSGKIEVGEWVLAIGSPFGFESSATSGIVSATGRSLPTDTYVPFIQTDVAINPGNSGGPLFNLDGEVVGVNSQIYSRSGGFMGVSFAIPINIVMDVVSQLKANGKVSRGWIGVYIQEVDQNLAQSFGMTTPTGALVAQVVPAGPAVNVLQLGDVIVEINGKPVANAGSLPAMVGTVAPGQSIKLVVIRNRERKELDLKIGELPSEEGADPAAMEEQSQTDPAGVEVLGMQITSIDDTIREALGLAVGGVLVEKVSGDPAQRAGINSGDVLTLLDGKPVDSPEQVKKIASEIEKGKTVAVLVYREGAARFMAMKVE